jgi:hypothetical protein
MAFLVLLEALSPAQRAVFMLREVFGYSYLEVARITGNSEVNCRQIFARARQRIASGGQVRDSAQPRRGGPRARNLPAGSSRPRSRSAMTPRGRVFTVFELEVRDGLVQRSAPWSISGKLGHVGPVSDVARLRPGETSGAQSRRLW